MSSAVRSFGLFLAFFALLSSPARAEDPVQFVQNLGNKAVSILADKTMSAEQKNDKFRTMLRDTFDLQTIARFVIGRSWNAASPEQKAEYMDLFEKLVVKTYSDRFALYTGEGFQAKSSRPEGDKDFLVNSIITHPDGSAPTDVDWRLRQKDGKLGIIDVTVEGVGMSVTQRQEFAAIIQRSGGDIGPLLAEMKKRIETK
jgi:phospholipid transport system substrate-binding protein